MKATMLGVSVLIACLAATLFQASSAAAPKSADSWNPKAAAAYLDYRAGWWINWPVSARDHQTFCISCHTALPYALSRAALRPALAEQGPSINERKLLDSVTKRVRLWKEVEPFYPDEKRGVPKTAESRGTESVLNALILASHDATSGKLSDDTRTAFENMWALQHTTGSDKGAWAWLQFNNEPWEAYDSQYYGAALAAVAVSTAPQNYRATPAIQNNLDMLRDYLTRESPQQSSINRVVLLWAATKWADLLKPAERAAIIKEILDKQQADGGWSLVSLVGKWKRHDDTPLEGKSDGYATGIITLVLQEAGMDRNDVHLQQGLAWLQHNQNPKDGRWPGYSLNNGRDPASETGLFMSDAATAYAVLALTHSK